LRSLSRYIYADYMTTFLPSYGSHTLYVSPFSLYLSPELRVNG